MAKGYRPVERDQSFLLPPDLREWLSEDHLAWFVLDVVEQLDTSSFHRGYVVSGPGRAAFDPDMLLGLVIYAYCQGVRSSRQMERLCQVDVAFRVMCGQDPPDHCTISRFLRDRQEAVTDLFAEVLRLCARAGLGRLGIVAIDGTKIAADASLDANREEAWLREQAAGVVADGLATDAAEDEMFGSERGDEMPEPLRRRGSRAARIKECLDDITRERAERAAQTKKARGEQAQASTKSRAQAARDRYERVKADRQAEYERIQQARNDAVAEGRKPGGTEPVPPAEHSHVRRARARLEQVEAALSGGSPLPPMGRRGAGKTGRVEEAGSKRKNENEVHRNVTDPDSRIMPTRRGWVQGYNAQLAVSEDGLILAVELGNQPNDVEQFLPMMNAAHAAVGILNAARPRQESIGYVLADAGYCSKDNLTAPGPLRLIATGKGSKLHNEAARSPTSTAPPPDASPITQMSHRLRAPETAATYKRRGAIVEPANARIKDQHGLRVFRRRGLKAAEAELTFTATVANLRLLHRRAATLNTDPPPE